MKIIISTVIGAQSWLSFTVLNVSVTVFVFVFAILDLFPFVFLFVFQAYVRSPVISVSGGREGFDGFRIGLVRYVAFKLNVI